MVFKKTYQYGFIRSHNFTIVSDRDPNGDWGVAPKSGPFNINGTWGGVMGAVVNGDYDFSMSIWASTVDRESLLEMAPIMRRQYILVILLNTQCR